jgi:hypothetical protein
VLALVDRFRYEGALFARETSLKKVYLVAIEQAHPAPLESIRTTLESDEVEFVPQADGASFTVRADEVTIQVEFVPGPIALGDSLKLVTGSDEALKVLRSAKGCYQILFQPGRPQGSVAVFEALWCARALMEQVPAVLLDLTSMKLHAQEDVAEITELDFDIRDHLNLHALEATSGETPLWVHSHGMEKFGIRDVEVFHLAEDDLLATESFLHELCTDLAFGQGPELRTVVETNNGETFMLLPSEDARVNLMGVPLEAFEGHNALYFTVVSPGGRHNLSELLRPYRERFAQEPVEKTAQMRDQAQALLPAFKARFQRKGLMEPLSFLVRSPFETHPEGEAVTEQLWLEVLSWDEQKVLGKLLDGAMHTTEWRKGAQVEVEEDQINALALEREGRSLEQEEVSKILLLERPM